MATKKAKGSKARKPHKAAGDTVNKFRGGPTPEKGKLREELVNFILRNGKEIIRQVVEEAKKGNYLPAKFLFEFAGIAEPLPDSDEAALARVKSLAEILFERVQEEAPGDAVQQTPAG